MTPSGAGEPPVPRGRIRDALPLLPGTAVEFSVNAGGEVLLHPALPSKGIRGVRRDRFGAVRGRAHVRWRTDELMKLLRADG